MRTAHLMLALLLGACAAALEAGQPEPTSPVSMPEPEPAPPTPPQPLALRFADRLHTLTPTRPEDYYLLGEELAPEVATSDDRQLTVTLYVLAAHLDIQRSTRPLTASAACVALADLIKSERDRRWLIYLARTLDSRRVQPEWLARTSPPTIDSPVYQIATALGLVRSGHGVQARQMLEKPDVQSALERFEPIMKNLGGGSLATLNREASLWPCPQCNNTRMTRRGNPPEVKLCTSCRGDPGPQLSEAVFLAQLRFESLLLQGTQRSWAAQALADGAAPLRDNDPSTLPVVFDVDPARVLWRNGQWVNDPSVPPRPASQMPGPPASSEPKTTAPPSDSGS